MSNPLIITIPVKGGKKFSYLTENNDYYTAVNNVGKRNAKANNKVFTLNDLRNAAARSGDLGVLEYGDLTPAELVEYAKISGEYKDYDISLSKDGKFFVIKIVKEPGFFRSAVTARDVKKAFGLKDGVLIDNNPELQQSMGRKGSGKQYSNLDNGEMQKGTVIRIPVREVTLEH